MAFSCARPVTLAQREVTEASRGCEAKRPKSLLWLLMYHTIHPLQVQVLATALTTFKTRNLDSLFIFNELVHQAFSDFLGKSLFRPLLEYNTSCSELSIHSPASAFYVDIHNAR